MEHKNTITISQLRKNEGVLIESVEEKLKELQKALHELHELHVKFETYISLDDVATTERTMQLVDKAEQIFIQPIEIIF